MDQCSLDRPASHFQWVEILHLLSLSSLTFIFIFFIVYLYLLYLLSSICVRDVDQCSPETDLPFTVSRRGDSLFLSLSLSSLSLILNLCHRNVSQCSPETDLPFTVSRRGDALQTERVICPQESTPPQNTAQCKQ